MVPLEAKANPFGGQIIDPDHLPDDIDRFAAQLDYSIEHWRDEGVKVVWLQLPILKAKLVPPAVDRGFVYHHATQQWLELTLTLVPGSYIPPFATHYIGAGGVVITADRKLLVIQERHHTRRHLKMPGGALHPGEHIAQAVTREVHEETGVQTRFESLACFRHWHGYRYGKSDIYFVCKLTPLSFDITPDPEEIAECMWMPVEEYLASPDTHRFNRRIVQAVIDLEGSPDSGPAPQLALRPEVLIDYGTPETHELFFPRPV